jgi:hypothetical protein
MIISISTMAVLIIVVVLKRDLNTCVFKMLLSLVRIKIHYEGSTTVYLPHQTKYFEVLVNNFLYCFATVTLTHCIIFINNKNDGDNSNAPPPIYIFLSIVYLAIARGVVISSFYFLSIVIVRRRVRVSPSDGFHIVLT